MSQARRAPTARPNLPVCAWASAALWRSRTGGCAVLPAGFDTPRLPARRVGHRRRVLPARGAGWPRTSGRDGRLNCVVVRLCSAPCARGIDSCWFFGRLRGAAGAIQQSRIGRPHRVRFRGLPHQRLPSGTRPGSGPRAVSPVGRVEFAPDCIPRMSTDPRSCLCPKTAAAAVGRRANRRGLERTGIRPVARAGRRRHRTE